MGNLFCNTNDLAGAVVHPDGKDFAGAGAGIILKHLECQVISWCARCATAIIISSTFIPATSIISSSGCTNDAPIWLKGTRWSGLSLDCIRLKQ
jgi:hypothetical protein